MSRRIMRVGKEGVATGAGSVGHCGLVSFRPGSVGVVFWERICYRFRGCSSGWRGFELGLVARWGGRPPAWAGCVAPNKDSPDGQVFGKVAPNARPGLPFRVGGAGREFVPRETHRGCARRMNRARPEAAATSAQGAMRSTCLRPFGSRPVWSARLSHVPARVTALAWGRFEATGRGLSLTVLFGTAQRLYPAGVFSEVR